MHQICCSLSSTQECADTKARCELALRYLTRQECTFDHKRLPADKQWPPPGTPSFPFGGGLVDYLRPIGPGAPLLPVVCKHTCMAQLLCKCAAECGGGNKIRCM